MYVADFFVSRQSLFQGGEHFACSFRVFAKLTKSHSAFIITRPISELLK